MDLNMERKRPPEAITPPSKGGGWVRPSKKGEHRAGRPAGSQNKIPKLMRDTLLVAADMGGELEEHLIRNPETGEIVRVTYKLSGKGGLLGFCLWVMRNHPVQFFNALVKTMPMQLAIKGAVDLNVRYETEEEARRALEERGIPVQLLEEDDEQLKLPAPAE